MQEVTVKQATTPAEMEAIGAMRRKVFVEEQGVAEALELDGLDDIAYHAVAYCHGLIVGTGRLLVQSNGDALIGRMAVNKDSRRTGIGGRVLEFLENAASTMGADRITLHAQYYVRQFYLIAGYTMDGEPFEEAGIQHILMSKPLG